MSLLGIFFQLLLNGVLGLNFKFLKFDASVFMFSKNSVLDRRVTVLISTVLTVNWLFSREFGGKT